MARIDRGRGTSVKQFESDAKKLLWAKTRTPGNKHPDYDNWKTRIAEITSQRKISRLEAVLIASKERACLAPLMNEYDFESYGIVGSPDINEGGGGIVCLNKKQSYRDNLRWALSAAGELQMLGVQPAECPNNSAYYLYTQALEDPKDFLQKIGQVESKVLESERELEDTKRQSKRSISELDEQLATLEEEEKADDVSKREEDN